MSTDQDPILSVDFDAMYRRQWERSSYGPRSSSDWNRRAAERYRLFKIGDYERAFMKHMDLTDARSVLDIGCGTGNLAVPLARKVSRVYALDFSEEMLRHLREHARASGVDNIRAFCLSWTDSWRRVPRADIAVCSRAMSVKNLRAALVKMSRHAKKRCYATIHAKGNYVSADIARLLDRTITPRPDYIYAVNILYQLGCRASVTFIRSPGGRRYENLSAFLEGIAWRIGRLSPREIRRLSEFYDRLPRDARGARRHRHDFKWALLSWETPR